MLLEFLTEALVALFKSLLVLVYPGLSVLTQAGCAFDEIFVMPMAIFWL